MSTPRLDIYLSWAAAFRKLVPKVSLYRAIIDRQHFVIAQEEEEARRQDDEARAAEQARKDEARDQRHAIRVNPVMTEEEIDEAQRTPKSVPQLQACSMRWFRWMTTFTVRHNPKP